MTPQSHLKFCLIFTAIATSTGTLAAIGTTYVLSTVGVGAAGVKAGSLAAGGAGLRSEQSSL